MVRPTVIVLITLAFTACRYETRSTWEYKGEFHRAIASADRILIRDGPTGQKGAAEDNPVLGEITTPSEIKEVLDNLEFEVQQTYRRCTCHGYPQIDWYQGEDRIALTSVQHGRAIRWRSCPGDIELTPRSSDWLVRWLTRHKVQKERPYEGPQATNADQPQGSPPANQPSADG